MKELFICCRYCYGFLKQKVIGSNGPVYTLQSTQVYCRAFVTAQYDKQKRIMDLGEKMNIFYLHKNTAICAQWHCDKHVNKMILESAQMLCSALHRYGDPAPYKAAYVKHPSTIWTGNSLSHWLWVKSLACELNKEAKRRYKRKVDHKSWTVIKDLFPKNIPDYGWLCDPPQCMPENLRQEDTIQAYRDFYFADKSSFAEWTIRQEPSWYTAIKKSGRVKQIARKPKPKKKKVKNEQTATN